METCRKSVTMALLLLIHLLTLQNGEAIAGGREAGRVTKGGVVLEEAAVAGGGNDAANATAEDPAGSVADAILPLASKREMRRRGARETPSSSNDNDNLSKLRHAIDEYEPQRIVSRKAKRRIGAPTSGTYGSTTTRVDLQTPRDTSRTAPTESNGPIGATANLHPSWNLGRATVRATTTRTTYSDDVDVVSGRRRTTEGSLDEVVADGDAAPTTPEAYRFEAPRESTGSRNGSSPPNVDRPDHSTASGDHRARWNVRELSSQIASPFTNDGNARGVLDADNPSEEWPSIGTNATPRSSSSRRDRAPRPFAVSRSSSPAATAVAVAVANVDSSRGRLRSSPPPSADVDQRISRPSSWNGLPLPSLPTDLFGPPAATRHYVPIERASRLDPDGNSDASTFAVAASAPSGRPNDRALVVAKIVNPSATRVESGPTSYVFQRQRQARPAISKQEFSLGAGPDLTGFALYDRFASSYAAHASAPAAGDHRDHRAGGPTLPSRVSALPLATLRPVSLAPLSPRTKVRPSASTAAAKPLAPYYDGRLLVSLDAGDVKGTGEDSEDSEEESIETEQPRATGVKQEAAGDASPRNHEDRVNETRDAASSSERRRPEGSRRQERERDREQPDGHLASRDESDDGNDGSYEEDADAKGAGETPREDERVDSGEDEEDERERHHRYEYDRDESEEEEGSEQRRRYSRKKYEGKDRRDKSDPDAGVRWEGGYRYPYKSYDVHETRAEDEEYREARVQPRRDSRREKDRREDEEEEDESVAEDEPIGQRSEDQQRGKHEKRRNDEATRTRYRNRTVPQKDLNRDANEHGEERDEIRLKQVRRKYRRERGKGDRRGRDDESQDDDNAEPLDHGETREHGHKHEEHHGKEKDGEGDRKFEEGEGGEHEEEHHGRKGEKGDKGYKVWHENEKAEKGYHDKERASKEYDEKEGEKKKHEEEDGYHEEHRGDEAGKKTSEFGEKGEHQKGHSTKGEHSVHKKDEYEKKTEFFDEFHEDGDVEKHGGHHHEHESKKGGHYKKGHHDKEDDEEEHGKKGKYEKGGHYHEHKGHKVAEGHDHHHDHDEKYGESEGHEHGKKWSYKKADDGGKHER